MQKQSDLLLNADDLDAMWVCLRENCVIDDATGAEKVFYHIHCYEISEILSILSMINSYGVCT